MRSYVNSIDLSITLLVPFITILYVVCIYAFLTARRSQKSIVEWLIAGQFLLAILFPFRLYFEARLIGGYLPERITLDWAFYLGQWYTGFALLLWVSWFSLLSIVNRRVGRTLTLILSTFGVLYILLWYCYIPLFEYPDSDSVMIFIPPVNLPLNVEQAIDLTKIWQVSLVAILSTIINIIDRATSIISNMLNISDHIERKRNDSQKK